MAFGNINRIVSSYRDCSHEPKHTWETRQTCIELTMQSKKEAASKKKRVKHVVQAAEVPHLWFHKVQDSARNAGGNFYFNGDTIFSYGSHFPIARHISKGKKQAVLFTTRTYSVTTSSHISAVRSAIPSSALVFNVPQFPYAGYSDESSEHAKNIKDYIERIETNVLTSARARSSWKIEHGLTTAASLVAEAKAYAKFYGLKLPKLPRVPEADSDKLKQIKKKEIVRQKIEAAKNKVLNAERAERQRLYDIERAAKEATKIEDWRNGIRNDSSMYGVPVMLRISEDEVETSRGARIPIDHALRALQFIRKVVARGEEFVTNGHTFHVGHYKIDRVEATGRLHAGCHIIEYAEIERLAPLLETYFSQANRMRVPE